jgi:hypothetical protein
MSIQVPRESLVFTEIRDQYDLGHLRSRDPACYESGCSAAGRWVSEPDQMIMKGCQ